MVGCTRKVAPSTRFTQIGIQVAQSRPRWHFQFALPGSLAECSFASACACACERAQVVIIEADRDLVEPMRGMGYKARLTALCAWLLPSSDGCIEQVLLRNAYNIVFTPING